MLGGILRSALIGAFDWCAGRTAVAWRSPSVNVDSLNTHCKKNSRRKKGAARADERKVLKKRLRERR